jgi:PST family polysaccharide transporter
MTWCTSGWRPHFPIANSGVKPLIKFGAHLSLADFVGQISANADAVLLGRFFGAEPLGLYTRASVLLARPIQQVITPINSVLIPVLSRLQSDPGRYKRSYMRAYDTLALIVFTFAATCLVLARPLVIVILGAKWLGVVPLFAAFTLVAISGPLAAVCTWIYESQGRGRDQLRNHTAAGVVTVASYLIGLPWGPIGVIVSLAITSIAIRMPIVYYIAGRRGPVGTFDLWKAFLAHLPCWGIVYITTSVAYRLVQGYSPLSQLMLAAPIGLAVGGALILLLRRPRQSALFAWTTAKSALRARFATS